MKIISLAIVFISLSAAVIFGQSNVFTYQGQLRNAGIPATNGLVPMTFQLMGSPAGADNVGGPISTNVGVTNGLFTMRLDFSSVPSAFNGQQRWLQLTVDGTPLSPRQELTSTPYSSYSYNAALAQSVASGSVTANSLQANLLTNGTLFGVWSLAGNSGINAASQFLGTTDSRPLNLRANNKSVMRFMEGTNTGNTLRAVNVLGGSEANSFGPGVIGGTIAGGGLHLNAGGDVPNQINGDFGFIGGGAGNFIDAYRYAAIGGGSGNALQGAYSAIVGGSGNNVQSDYSLIGGGQGNYLFGIDGTIAGGELNSVTGSHSFVGGGGKNTASGFYSSVGGGIQNTAGSDYGVVVGGRTNAANGPYGFIGGGQNNKSSDFFGSIPGGEANVISSGWATIGGGSKNNAGAQLTTIAGGDQNYAGATWATVGGGLQNWATGVNSVAGGGYLNQAAGSYATVPGGYNCYSGGIGSFAAGYRAVASYNGSFVWSDNSAEQDFAATAANQFCIRAQGGIVIESFGNVGIYTGVGTTDAGRYVLLLNSPKAPSASGLKAGGVLVADAFNYANPGKSDLVVKGTLSVGYPNPAPYTMAVNGNVFALNGYLSSDARFKTNINTLPHALATVQSLRGVSFNWRKDDFKESNFPTGRQVGFIAQEVEAVLPELVMTDNRGYRALAYQSIIPVLVEAMKEQQEEISIQRKKIQELEQAKDERMNNLQAQINDLKKSLAASHP